MAVLTSISLTARPTGRHPRSRRSPTTRSRGVLGPRGRPASAGLSDQAPDLPRSGWESRLEELNKQHEGHDLAIELLDREIGDETEAVMLPVASIEYDPKDDVVIVAVGGRDGRFPVVLRHMVEHPQRIAVDELDEQRTALETVDDDGTRTIVTIQTIQPPAVS
jgi:Family of unknown function (DUF5335)